MSQRTDILIHKENEFPDAQFHVQLTSSNGSQTNHYVSLNEQYYKQLTSGAVMAEHLIRESFRFLLEREPQQAILETFELPIISRYFPEYETAIKSRIMHV